MESVGSLKLSVDRPACWVVLFGVLLGLAAPLAAQPAKTDAAKTNDIVIVAHEFLYDGKSGLAVYTGDVRAEDAQMVLTCGVLTAKFAVAGSEMESIVAEKSVVLINKLDQTRGQGDKAVYTAATDVVELTGSPTLETTQGTLVADVVVLDRRQNKLHATGHVRMKLKPEALKQPGLLAPKNPAGAEPRPQPKP